MIVPAAAAVPVRNVLAADPLLCWQAIAAHARDRHGHTWPSSDAAITAIVGAFDAIVPSGCDYSPADGTVIGPALPARPSWVPRWNDPQLLNCTIAVLAASLASCDLQQIYGEVAFVSPHAAA